MLGLMGFATQLPAFVLGPVAGVWVIELDRHRVLLATKIAGHGSVGLAGRAGVPAERSPAVQVLVLGAVPGVASMRSTKPPDKRFSWIWSTIGPTSRTRSSELLHGQSRADAGPTAAGILIATGRRSLVLLLDAAKLSGGHRLAARDGGQALVASGETRRAAARPGEGFSYVLATSRSARCCCCSARSVCSDTLHVLMPVFAAACCPRTPHARVPDGGPGLGALWELSTSLRAQSVVGLGRLIPAGVGTFGLSFDGSRRVSRLLLSMLVMVVWWRIRDDTHGRQQHGRANAVDDDKRGRVMSLLRHGPGGGRNRSESAGRCRCPITGELPPPCSSVARSAR